ncbi:hypothetical protein [Sulfitobacter delicatus]|uniref:Uncharacterized protein n=1 Tax=Sulfitobacter delicatus TaxID=218672 RepID=A0A1G7NUT3_9RHOB|nr:hypothetical protein [Sulfitobacter delicatus]SDF77796.1 hypothetical protein SAMN04489759_103133 [Sulfitobacter delicatus]
MIDFLFAVIAAGMSGQGAPSAGITAPPAPEAPVTVQAPAAPEAPASPGVPAAPAVPVQKASFDMSVVPAGLQAEDQTPSGKFTTATEVKPILNATRGNWVAVREYEGKDYVYVTHLWSWRCGLAAIAISVNDEQMQNWPMPPCHTEFSTPNAILNDDPNPLLTFKPGSVEKVTIQVVYDDLSMDSASFARGEVLIP